MLLFVMIGLYGGLIGFVLPNDLFHPHHIVPAAELVAAVAEGAAQRKTEMRVELGAVFGQVFVLYLREADAGIQVQNAHIL